MSNETSLIQAICEDPDDEGVRLIYADWLEENGHPERAEFIRADCEADRLAEGKERRRLVKRVTKLLEVHSATWFGPVANPSIVTAFETRRGFVEVICLTVDQFGRHAPLILDHCPLVREVFLTQRGNWTSCFARPEWERIAHLGLEDELLTNVAAIRLAECPFLANLRSLNLGFNFVGPGRAARLASSPHLARLEQLSLLDGGIKDRGALPFLTQSRFRGLVGLNLGGNDLTDATARALADASHLTGLVELDLFDNQLTDAGAEAIASAAHLAGLQSLNLHSNQIGDRGAAALLESPHLVSLTQLALFGNLISRPMWKRIQQRSREQGKG